MLKQFPNTPQRTFEFRSVLILGLLILLVCGRMDGWGNRTQTILSELVLLPFTLIFIGLIALNSRIFAKDTFFVSDRHLPSLASKISLFRLAFAFASLEQCLMISLLVVQAFYFHRQGYLLNKPGIFFVSLVSIAAFTLAARSARHQRPAMLLLAAFFSFLSIETYSIFFFPLTPLRSDNLPLILSAIRNLLAGNFPYVVYPLASGDVVLTYLPATWLVYLPAAAMHIDIRWTNAILALAAVGATYFAVPPRSRGFASSLLSIFLLFPYAQFHHDIYISLQWLIAALAFAALQRKRWLLAGAVFGWGIAASQLFWITLPFLMLYLFQRTGLKRTLFVFLAIIAVAIAWMAPFFFYSPDRFFFGIMTHWSTSNYISARVFNFTFWEWTVLQSFGSATIHLLQRLQAIALMILFFIALRRKITNQSEFWSWATAAVTLFALTNFLVWAYFYVTAFFMMILSLLGAAVQDAPNHE